MDLGPHAAFIWISYAVFGLVLASLVGWLWIDGKRQAHALAMLEAAGVKRRTVSPDDVNSSGSATP
jgi:heme exporter protein D